MYLKNSDSISTYCIVIINFPFISKKTSFDYKFYILDKKYEMQSFCRSWYCKGMNDFPTRFHKLWNDCFSDTAICNTKPIVGSKRSDNLQDYLVKKKPDKSLLKIDQ